MTRAYLRSAGLVAFLAATTACGGGDDAPPAGETATDRPPQAAPPSQTPAADTPANVPEGVTAAQIQQGQQIFAGQGICFTCHAVDGTGSALAPDLTDGEWLWIDPATGDVLAQIDDLVRQGVPEPLEYPAPMPPMGGSQLSDEQIQAVSAYVYSLSQQG